MSRHRNVRNLTEDDYYDDYDDDDYYEEEDEDYYYEQQEQQRREREERERAEAERRAAAAIDAAKKKKSATVAAGKAAAGGGGGASATAITPAERSERERLVGGMGFSSAQARSALEANGYDVQRSVDSLLGGGGGGGKGQGAAPPPPPPGFANSTVGKNKPARAVAAATPSEEERKRLIAAFDATPPPGIGSSSGGNSGGGGGGGSNKAAAVVSSVSIGGGGGSGPKKKTDGATTTSAPSSSSSSSAEQTTTQKKKGGGKGSKVSPSPPPQAPSPSSSQPAVAPPAPRVSSELLESLKKQRSRLSMVVLGHVDAGKSTLMGQVLLQLGHVEKRTVTKYQKQAAEIGKASFALAWVMDEDDSERERGVTMEIGTKYARTPNHDLTILDAPGHADFVPAMITGAASADVGLLVVASTTGEFEAGFEPGEKGRVSGGQTREHIILSRGLGVSRLIVAVNKLDAAEPPWSRDRVEQLK